MTGPKTPSDEPLETVVLGYPLRYVAAVWRLLGIEGGHSNDPIDRGGETNLGISLRFLRAEGQIDLDGDDIADFDLDMDGDIDGADIRALTRGDAVWLYHACFWKRLGCDALPAPIGEMVFDQAVNGGAAAAKKLLQRAINAVIASYQLNSIPVAVDGAIGPRTLQQLDNLIKRPDLGVAAIVRAYRAAAADRYRAIVAADPSQKRFINGWLRRAAELGKL